MWNSHTQTEHNITMHLVEYGIVTSLLWDLFTILISTKYFSMKYVYDGLTANLLGWHALLTMQSSIQPNARYCCCCCCFCLCFRSSFSSFFLHSFVFFFYPFFINRLLSLRLEKIIVCFASVKWCVPALLKFNNFQHFSNKQFDKNSPKRQLV